MTKERNSTQISTKHGINTQLAHMGNNPHDCFGFVNPPVVRGSTVLFPDYETMRDRNQKYTYGTHGTPTTDALANALNMLEGAAGTRLVPSGLAAITMSLLAFAKAGMHILLIDSIYYPNRRFCDNTLSSLGVEIEYFSPLLGEDFENLMRANTGIVMLEIPGSNSMEMCDIPLLTTIAHTANPDCVVMVDNTWATPLFFRPLDHGVDISIQALTKYPSGHSDVLMGSICANERHWNQVDENIDNMGVCVGSDDAYVILRSMRSMAVRLAHHQKSTMEICQWLQSHENVARVLYPALPDDPGYTLWKRDFSGATGLFTFIIKDADREAGGRFLNALEIFGLGYSWAGYESLAVMPSFLDRVVDMPPQGGVAIRLQIGLEDPVDLIADIERGFAAL
ncbi:cystathionine beta-lyase [Ahrensia sp. AH-315-G08]|nr:cystathionine beta-lyase [Ahrensia sp. AH-315-G08]